MGLTLAEAGIFFAGAALIVRFLLRAALPQARTRIVSAANRHSDELREEFILLPPARIAAVLLASATVLAGAALAVRLGVASKPEAYSWRQLAGAATLAGIGFTMSLYIAAKAFPDPADFNAAKVGVFVASILAGALGVALLRACPEGRNA